MPNWCYNKVTIRSGDKEELDQFERFLKDGNGEDWFNFFLPTPSELNDVQSPNRDGKSAEQLVEKYGAADWYDWNIANWGTKWNCNANSVTRDSDGEISFTFDSAWAPPTLLYQQIANGDFGDFDVEALYLEEGMGFVGKFENGYDDYYEYSDLASLDEIPEEIIEYWNLREQLEEQAEWEEEEELERLRAEFDDEIASEEGENEK